MNADAKVWHDPNRELFEEVWKMIQMAWGDQCPPIRYHLFLLSLPLKLWPSSPLSASPFFNTDTTLSTCQWNSNLSEFFTSSILTRPFTISSCNAQAIFVESVDTFGVQEFYECSYVVPVPGHFPPLWSIHDQGNGHSLESYIGIDQARLLKVLTMLMNFSLCISTLAAKKSQV